MRYKNMPEPVAERAVLRVPEVARATATELQNNFGKYMDVVEAGGMVIVTKNGRKFMRLVPVQEKTPEANERQGHTPILQAIRDLGITMPELSDADEAREAYLRRKYSSFNDRSDK